MDENEIIERRACISGIGQSPIARRLEASPMELTLDACLLAIDDAIRRLEEEDSSLAEIVTLRFFAGLSIKETAHVIGASLRTTERRWRYIRAKLRHYLDEHKAR